MTVRLGGYQAWSRRGDLRRLRLILGLVFLFRPQPDQLADPDQRVHWHDRRAGHLWCAALAYMALVSALMGLMVLQGRYWVWEKIALIFCVVNLVYIPAAFMVHPTFRSAAPGVDPPLPGRADGHLFFFLMANVGTTIAPGWFSSSRAPWSIRA